MRTFLHGWLPVLLIFALAAGLLVLAERNVRRRNRPLTLAEEELAPYYPYGVHPVVLPQTFVVAGDVTYKPSPPPSMPMGQEPVLAG